MKYGSNHEMKEMKGKPAMAAKMAGMKKAAMKKKKKK